MIRSSSSECEKRVREENQDFNSSRILFSQSKVLDLDRMSRTIYTSLVLSTILFYLFTTTLIGTYQKFTTIPCLQFFATFDMTLRISIWGWERDKQVDYKVEWGMKLENKFSPNCRNCSWVTRLEKSGLSVSTERGREKEWCSGLGNDIFQI